MNAPASHLLLTTIFAARLRIAGWRVVSQAPGDAPPPLIGGSRPDIYARRGGRRLAVIAAADEDDVEELGDRFRDVSAGVDEVHVAVSRSMAPRVHERLAGLASAWLVHEVDG